jgi:hypothetical protein
MKMTVLELKAKIKEDIISLLSEQDEENEETEDKVEDVEVEDTEEDTEDDIEDLEMGFDTDEETIAVSDEDQEQINTLKSYQQNALNSGNQSLADQYGRTISLILNQVKGRKSE